ncbi:hypothetical protein C8F01DRAFT_676983 [Mycena amicta]|nr:hypothetical protein C8F01DRAFT_676983 [Mycena amicta]
MLVYPAGHECHKCNNTGYRHSDPSHPCRRCWDKYAKPYAGALLVAPAPSPGGSSGEFFIFAISSYMSLCRQYPRRDFPTTSTASIRCRHTAYQRRLLVGTIIVVILLRAAYKPTSLPLLFILIRAALAPTTTVNARLPTTTTAPVLFHHLIVLVIFARPVSGLPSTHAHVNAPARRPPTRRRPGLG